MSSEREVGRVDVPEKGVHTDIVEDRPIAGVAATDDEVIRRMSVVPGMAETCDAAMAGTEAEKSMSLMEGIRLYPKAIGWSMLLSTAIVIEGYDVVLLQSFFAFPEFQRKYGHYMGKDPDTGAELYQLTAPWQSGLSIGANIGEIIGLFLTGIIAERLGYRKTMILALSSVVCFIFVPFFAPNVQTLLAGEILCGIPWGVFQTLTTTYASEVMPVPLRAYLTTYVNLCWVFGQLIASGVLRGMLSRTDQWGYRIPFALQWMWPVPILIGCIFAPESPWWCVRRGDTAAAKRNLLRLTSSGRNAAFSADDTVAMMVHTDALERTLLLRSGSTTTHYWDCFRGVDRRRTEITCVVWAIQNLCGSAFMGYSTYFYEQAGLDTAYAFDLSMAQYALGALGTALSWVAMGRAGRRSLYLGGLAALVVLLLVIGVLGCLAPSAGASWAVGSMLLLYTFVYDASVGPVCYALVAEMASVRLRQKTIVLARNFYNVWGIVNYVWMPLMLNPGAWNWGAKTGFFWAGCAALCLLWTYFRLPEPKGRTYGELDVLFENKVSARRFRTTDATQFHGRTLRMKSVSGSVGGVVEHKEVA